MTQAEQLEQGIRVEVVFRALLSDLPLVAGVFAENHFAVEPGLIRLRWDTGRFGKLEDPVRFAASATKAMQRLGMPQRVLIEEVS
ncbi:MAG: hypothetical protein KGL39_52505 [Patescibacteria group bacterium]|nr:hypothetical protein [Patescibacteria group bacterium]